MKLSKDKFIAYIFLNIFLHQINERSTKFLEIPEFLVKVELNKREAG